MQNEEHRLSRRALVQLAGFTAAGSILGLGNAEADPARAISLFDGRTLDGWIQVEKGAASMAGGSSSGWIVKDGAMASTGAGRGVICSAKDYGRFRLMFTMRHVSGDPDHQACVLIFCSRPQGDEKPLDALGGIQFQVPNGGHWDYRPGKNNNGGAEFTSVTKTRFDARTWSSVEIVADAATGTARMAVAQPPGSKAVEVLAFNDPSAGKAGPIAWQMHNAGLFDEYKEISIELDPKDTELITIK